MAATAPAVSTAEQRKQRWRDFYINDGQHKLIYTIDYNVDRGPMPWPRKDNLEQRVDYWFGVYEYKADKAQWLEDDAIPFLVPHTGTEIFAEAFGCPVAYPVDNMPFARHLIIEPTEVARLKVPSLDCPALATVFELADRLRAKAGAPVPLGLPDIQSPMDIASLIWDKAELMIAMITDPQAVHDLAMMCRELLTAFLDEWFARYGTECFGHCPGYYVERGVTLSEDEVGTINPEMFETFFLPHLAFLSQRYGGIGIHCCANSRHQWDGFREIPRLFMLNICQPEEICREAYEYFSPDIAHMHWNWFPDGPEWTWMDQLPPNSRCAFELSADSKDAALELAGNMATSTGREFCTQRA